jgi:ABC-type bacteriocin/lantibiotic exporter with double-glycine peptidase domain
MTICNQRQKIYFAHSEKYVVTEQALACLPIYIAAPLVIMMMFLTEHTDASIGAFVAVLPRSLQLLGNVHSLSVYNSRFVLMKQKLKNLKCFVEKLERQDLKKQIEIGKIQVFDVHAGSNLSVQQFLDQMHRKELKQGRFLITGANGVGKSSLLRFIKSINTEAILVSPDANLVNDDIVASSGERQVRQIDFVFSQDTAIFLLDEWDANLDFLNVLKVEDKINLMAKKALIIEVRHKIAPP